MKHNRILYVPLALLLCTQQHSNASSLASSLVSCLSIRTSWGDCGKLVILGSIFAFLIKNVYLKFNPNTKTSTQTKLSIIKTGNGAKHNATEAQMRDFQLTEDPFSVDDIKNQLLKITKQIAKKQDISTDGHALDNVELTHYGSIFVKCINEIKQIDPNIVISITTQYNKDNNRFDFFVSPKMHYGSLTQVQAKRGEPTPPFQLTSNLLTNQS